MDIAQPMFKEGLQKSYINLLDLSQAKPLSQKLMQIQPKTDQGVMMRK